MEATEMARGQGRDIYSCLISVSWKGGIVSV